MSDLAHSQMTRPINLPDTFCDNLRQLMHEVFNIPYADFGYDHKYEIVSIHGPVIELPFRLDYIYGQHVEGRKVIHYAERYRLRFVFSKQEASVWSVKLADTGNEVDEEVKVFTLKGMKEWTALELFDLKKQLVQRFPLNLVVGPCIEGER